MKILLDSCESSPGKFLLLSNVLKLALMKLAQQGSQFSEKAPPVSYCVRSIYSGEGWKDYGFEIRVLLSYLTKIKTWFWFLSSRKLQTDWGVVWQTVSHVNCLSKVKSSVPIVVVQDSINPIPNCLVHPGVVGSRTPHFMKLTLLHDVMHLM